MSEPSAPVRILFLADFCGKHEPPRKPTPVAAGGIDAAMAALSPSIEVPAGTAKVAFAPARLDDFGPGAAAALVGGDGEERAKRLDALFHHPGFLALEAAWRGLAAALEWSGDTPVVFEILSAPREEAVERFHEIVFEDEYEDRSEVPLALVACDHDFTHGAADLVHLNNMGKLGEAISAPWMASAGPGLFGIKNLYHVGGLSDFTRRFTESGYSGFRKLQESAASRWVGLTLNRILLRPPHADEGLGYTEAENPAHPEWRPWGRGIWPAAAAVARSYGTHGHPADLDGIGSPGDFSELVTFPYPKGMRDVVTSPTETLIEEVSSLDLVHSGLSPLIGKQGGSTAYFPMLANLHRPSPGQLLLEAAVAYQLILGDLVHRALRWLPHAPRETPEAAAAWITEKLAAWVEPYGDVEEDTIKVEPRSAEGTRSLAITVKPPIRLHNHDPEFTLELPLGGGS